MKNFRRFGVYFLCLCSIAIFLCCQTSNAIGLKSQSVSLLFTNNINSHLTGDIFISDDENIYEYGGMSGLNKVINEVKSEYPDSFLFDAGNYVGSRQYRAIAGEAAAELQLLGALGYDVTALGLAEFGLGTQTLADMLRTFSAFDQKPMMVASNFDVENCKSGVVTEAMKTANVQNDYVLVTRGITTVAVFSLCQPATLDSHDVDEFAFYDYIERAKSLVRDIEVNEESDMIVCLLSYGTDNYKKYSAEALAKAVPEIDVIVDAGNMQGLAMPQQYDKTLVVAADSETYSLGQLILSPDKDGRWSMIDYQLLPVSSDEISDDGITVQIDKYQQLANEVYFNSLGYDSKQVLVDNECDFPDFAADSAKASSSNFGDLVADSYIAAVQQAEGKKYVNVDIALVAVDLFGEPLPYGSVTAEDAYNALPYGYGNDGSIGYPLVSFYLTGNELKTLAEADASIGDVFPAMRLYIAGLGYTVNDKRIFCNRVSDVHLIDKAGNIEPLAKKELYRVVCDMCTAKLLCSLDNKSYSILSILPKNSRNQPASDLNSRIVYDGKEEVKAWTALADYLQNIGRAAEDILGTLTEYKTARIYKNYVSDGSLGARFSEPNRIVFILLILTAVLILLLWFLLWLFFWIRRRRIQKRKENIFAVKRKTFRFRH